MRTDHNNEKSNQHNDSQAMPRALPTFDGYTVDERLAEFRRADPHTGIVIIPFDTPRGMRLLRRYQHTLAQRDPDPEEFEP